MKRKACCDDKHFRVYGSTVMGERGQIVIPAEAREKLNIKKGDQFLVLSHSPKKEALVLMPMSMISEFIDGFRQVAEQVEKELKKNTKK